ncbi:hypothetical protein ACI2K4_05025 [Micromonospora sp. NPDC050397]|uniref:hypothetical protein n=1 Tax=Micromonospora sp. NPDC050397 TaxID=3364279 RepID=UPI00384B16D9
MSELDQWWNGLNEDDQDLFLRHRETSPLPAEVWQRAQSTGPGLSIVTEPVGSGSGATVNWVGPTSVFLATKAG